MENQKTNFDLGIVNADNQYTVQEEEQFSHQVLVMSAMRKCLEAGSREMVEGYFNTRADRSGNIIKTYVDDTRKAYIESVKSFRDILSCDMDKETRQAVIKIKKGLTDAHKLLCKEEETDWKNAVVGIRRYRIQKGIFLRVGSLNKELPYYSIYMNKELEAYRRMFRVLNNLTKAHHFFKEQGLQEFGKIKELKHG